MRIFQKIINILVLSIVIFIILRIIQPFNNPISNLEFYNSKIIYKNIGNELRIYLVFESCDLDKLIKKTNSLKNICFYSPVNQDINSFKAKHKNGIDSIGLYMQAVYYSKTNSLKNRVNLENSSDKFIYECEIDLIENYNIKDSDDLVKILNQSISDNKNIFFYGYISHFPFASFYKGGWSAPILVNQIQK